MVTVDCIKYTNFCEKAFLAAGFAPEASAEAARIMVRTDKLGIFSHGTVNLPLYLKKAACGGIDPKAAPGVEKEGPAWAIVDGHNALGTQNALFGLRLGMEKARKCGVSYVGVKNSGQYGACAAYAIEAAEHGFVVFAASKAGKSMTVPGGKGKIIGNSPIAYAAPAGEHPPVFMDIATSNIAGMKVNRARSLGQELPPGCIVDAEGNPATDPNTPDWALWPLGGHKGYCLSVFVEILTAALTGGAMLDLPFWMDPPAVPGCSHAFILLDVAAMLEPERFAARMQAMISEIAASPKAEGSERIWLPGEIEWENYARAEKNGLTLQDDIQRGVLEMAEELGLPFAECIIPIID